jgi:gamma-glutamyltranspeptidase/glutathione hydrolase
MIAATLLVLAACNVVKLSGSTPIGPGYVVGDEPHAVGVARDVLAHGGNAADAAAALGLALVATLPSRAGLGGGGACLVHTGRDIPSYTGILSSSTSNLAPTPTQSLDFMPQAARDGSAISVPGLPRGLSALQAKYGTLRWEQIVAPAENIARFGVPMSRALARDAARAPTEITGSAGRPLAEGERVVQSDLANSLDLLRSRGAGDFYLGRLAAAVVAGSNGELDADTLRSFTPKWASPKGVPFGNDMIYFTPNPGGAFAEKLWRGVRTGPDSSLYAKLLSVVGDAKPDTGDSAQRALAVADVAAPSLTAGSSGEPASDNDAATSFIVVDGSGTAVACSLTMGRLFGAGRSFGATGIRASLPVPGTASEGLSGAAMIVANESVSKFLAAIAGGGDRSGPEALVQVALGTLVARESVSDAMSVARLYAAGPGVLYVEPGLKLGQRSATTVPALGAVNAIICPGGLPAKKPDCSAQSDPRSAGQSGAIDTRQPTVDDLNNNSTSGPPKLQ